jgi:methylenetetrahydrofolate reductase (NADPH)
VTVEPAATMRGADAVLADLLLRPRYEVVPLRGIEEDVVANVPEDIKLTVTASPKRGLDATLDATAELARRGFQVVPHVSARQVVDEAHLAGILERLESLRLREVFVIAGDARRPAGRFADASALLAAMVELGHRLDEIGIAGYPEGHPFLSDEAALRALAEKEPVASYIVTQLSFAPESVTTWVARVRSRGIQLPVYVGVPGVVDRNKLLRIALRIGVGESVRFLRKQRSRKAGLLRRASYSPDGLLEGLAPALAEPGNGIRGFHVYTFNAVEQTERWRREKLARQR